MTLKPYIQSNRKKNNDCNKLNTLNMLIIITTIATTFFIALKKFPTVVASSLFIQFLRNFNWMCL